MSFKVSMIFLIIVSAVFLYDFVDSISNTEVEDIIVILKKTIEVELKKAVEALAGEQRKSFDVLKESLVHDLQESFQQQNKVIKEGFTAAHNFGRDRAKILKEASKELRFNQYNCKGVGTRHAFYIDGMVGQFFTPHFNCSNRAVPTNISDSIITHPNYDLGIILGCPEMDYAINVSTYTKAMLGDSVISYGFGESAKAWTGSISDEGTEVCYDNKLQLHNHWIGDISNINRDEVFVQSYQHSGQSGGPVSNGCGYVGMSHAVIVTPDGFANFCLLIPPKRMVELAKNHEEKLERLENCHGLKVLNLPIMPFMDCDIRSFENDQSDLCSDIKG